RFYERLDSLALALVATLDAAGLFSAMEASHARVMAAHVTPPGPGRYPSSWSRAEDDAHTAQLLEGTRPTRENFARLSAILRRLAALSEKELRGEDQTIDDGVFLKTLRFQLKSLAFNVSNSEDAQEPMAVITDPATEYRSMTCLEVGTGRPRAIYVT